MRGVILTDSSADIGCGLRTTLVMDSSEFVNVREEHLSLCFFDSKKLQATMFGKSRYFYVLSTQVNSGCEAVVYGRL